MYSRNSSEDKGWSVRVILLFYLVILTSCLQQTKPLRGGRDPTWTPQDLGTFAANTEAFTNAVIQQLNTEKPEIQLQNMPYMELFTQLQAGNLDVALSSLVRNHESAALYEFSLPILELGPVLVTRRDSPIQRCGDLTNKKVGVYAYDGSILLVQGVPGIILEEYTNIPTALHNLLTGVFDAVVAPPLQARSILCSQYKELVIHSPPLTDDGIRLITLKGHHKKEIQRWNHQLTHLNSTGFMTSLRDTFGVP